MLTARIPSTPTVPATVDSASEVPDPIPETSGMPPDPSSAWESAVTLLERRDWHSETIFHLWLRPSYLLGLHVLIGVGVSLQGHRRMVAVTECGPQDHACVEAVLDDLSSRGLGSGMLLKLPGNVALQAAVSCVWGSRAWVQRCLNTVMAETLSGPDSGQALQFRHRLQQAWQLCDASEREFPVWGGFPRDGQLYSKVTEIRSYLGALYASKILPATSGFTYLANSNLLHTNALPFTVLVFPFRYGSIFSLTTRSSLSLNCPIVDVLFPSEL